MLGAVVFTLRSKERGWIPEFSGRVMHGIFFRLLGEQNSELASFVHEKMIIKPFALSGLMPMKDIRPQDCSRGSIRVNKGDTFKWRIVALHETILMQVMQIQLNKVLEVNRIPMEIIRIVADGESDARSGIISVDQLIDMSFSEDDISYLTLRFLSPTTFRVDDVDYPMPLPKLVFSSLADKWLQLSMPLDFDRNQVQAMAESVYINQWNGISKSVYLTPKRGVNTFTGEFTYDLTRLELEKRQILLLLAQFGVFAGCGRMSGQGLGQLEVSYQ